MQKKLPKQNKIKIIAFSLTYFPFTGGAEIALSEIAEKLNEKTEIHLITSKLGKKLMNQEKNGSVRVYRVGSGLFLDKYLYPFQAVKKATELHAQNTYHICWGVMASWGGWAALKFKEKFSTVKYLLTLQSGDSDEFIAKRTWFWNKRYAQIYQKADMIQSISQWLAERAKKYGYTGKTEIIPNGVALDKIIKIKETEKIKHELNITNDQKIILSVSRLVEKNGIADLIKTVSLLRVPYKLLIAGDGHLKNKLEQLAQELHIQDKVIFLGDLEYSDLSSYYSIADVFVRPSISEGFGNVFIEAMSVGVPVIATPVGGIPDFLINNQTGWFCKINNPKSIAEKINFCLDPINSKTVNYVSQNAKEMARTKYSWEIIANNMYNQVFLKMIPYERV
jgi:glycosyltransferase involved in cell wall biosynthesis